jgi:hypothetical protein
MSEENEQLERIASALESNLPSIELDLNLIARSLQQIANELASPKADTLTLKLYDDGGILMGAPVTVIVGHAGTSTAIESIKASGVVVPAIGPLVYASDTPAVATIDANGVWVTLTPGTANLSVLDQGNGLTDTVALTVTVAPPPKADTMTFTLVPNPTVRR